MSVLTAPHAKVVAYNRKYEHLFDAVSLIKRAKEEYIKLVDQAVTKLGNVLDKLFPSKRQAMFDYLMFNLSATGIQSIHTRTFMRKFVVSESTVRRFVASLKGIGMFTIAQLSKEYAGTYIFVLNAHANYAEIMAQVFNIDIKSTNKAQNDTAYDTSSISAKPRHGNEKQQKKDSTLFTDLNNNLIYTRYNWLENGRKEEKTVAKVRETGSILIEGGYNWLDSPIKEEKNIEKPTLFYNWLAEPTKEKEKDELQWWEL